MRAIAKLIVLQQCHMASTLINIGPGNGLENQTIT